MLTLLKDGQFFRFWLGQVISSLGDGINKVVIIYLVAQLSNDPLVIGLVIFLQMLPTAIFSIFIGSLADRYSKKWIMVISDLYRMIIVLMIIPFQHSLNSIFILIALHGIGSALFNPARVSSIPVLVGRDRIENAISISQATRSAMNVIAPAIGGLLLTLNKLTLIFVIDAITFLFSAFFILTLTRLSKEFIQKSDESYIDSIYNGIKRVIGIPPLRFLLLLLIPVSFVVGVINTNISTLSLYVFKVEGHHYGLLQASVGIGAIIGSLVLCPLLLRKIKLSSLLLIGTLAIGLWMILIFPVNIARETYGLIPIYIWYLGLGLINTLLFVPLSSLFLRITPANFRGRGQAILSFTVTIFTMSGLLGGGWLQNYTGILLGTAVAGILLVVVVATFPFIRGYKELRDADANYIEV
ncbi:MFS transporter [Cytobacillus firmus]|uniref:MFS transporter n=1 Tax=Cytobacillus firmus TaxID=1399 RepID=UPI0018CD7429|nr:MFS transporter [Cytobacillus firmus]MBG9587252.1 hypothetical protein [Cytobacillus firmus]